MCWIEKIYHRPKQEVLKQIHAAGYEVVYKNGAPKKSEMGDLIWPSSYESSPFNWYGFVTRIVIRREGGEQDVLD